MKLPDSLVNAFVNATTDKVKETSSNKVLHASVVSIDEDSMMVTIDGSDTQTPVVKTCEAEVGDRVMVEIRNRQAYLVGNVSHPVNRVTGDDIISIIDQRADEIELGLYTKKDEVIAAINLSTETTTGGGVATINAAKINLNGVVTANNNVTIGVDGKLSCVNASVTGAITSSTINTGKFNVDSNGVVTLTGTSASDDACIRVKTGNNAYNTYIEPNGVQAGSSIYGSSYAKTTRVGASIFDANGQDDYGSATFYGQLKSGNAGGASVECYDGTMRVPIGSVNTDKQKLYRMYGKKESGQYTLYAQGEWGTSGGTTTCHVEFVTSDKRLKSNIKDSDVDALGLINEIKIRQFDWEDSTHQKIGFVADELEELDDRLATGGGYDDDGNMDIKSVNTFYLIGYLTRAVQQLSKRVEELEKGGY